MALLPDLREIAARGEDYLFYKHRAGRAPNKTLLMEMLVAKRRWWQTCGPSKSFIWLHPFGVANPNIGSVMMMISIS